MHTWCHVQAGNHGHGKCGLPIVGFCFSFAMEQAALNSGKLLVWSKGFTVDGVLGKDVVALLSGIKHTLRVLLAASLVPVRLMLLFLSTTSCVLATSDNC